MRVYSELSKPFSTSALFFFPFLFLPSLTPRLKTIFCFVFFSQNFFCFIRSVYFVRITANWSAAFEPPRRTVANRNASLCASDFCFSENLSSFFFFCVRTTAFSPSIIRKSEAEVSVFFFFDFIARSKKGGKKKGNNFCFSQKLFRTASVSSSFLLGSSGTVRCFNLCFFLFCFFVQLSSFSSFSFQSKLSFFFLNSDTNDLNHAAFRSKHPLRSFFSHHFLLFEL